MNDADHTAIVAALVADSRAELAQLRALHALYRALLEEAGIDAPDDSQGAEALRRYRFIFEQHGLQDGEQHNELLADWWSVPSIEGLAGTP